MLSLSLQAYLVSSRPQLSTIPVDPRGFKSAIQSLMGFLTAQNIPATLWLKLPKGDAWWTDVWAYGQQASGCTLYTLGEQTSSPPDNLAASLRPIAIEQGDDLKREYLCIAVASNFVCILLAVRMASGTTPSTDKRTIKLYCSTAGQATAALSTGLKQILNNSLSSSLEAHSAQDSEVLDDDELSLDEVIVSEADMAIHAVLSQWERCFPAGLLSHESLPLTEAFLTWQLQYQEEMRSQIAAYRSSAKQESAAYALSSDFLSRASQELQSPLTTIKTALTLLGAPTLKMGQRQRYLEMIGAQCDRQKSLIISIIDLLKAQTTLTATPQAIQLANLLPGIVSTYQPIAEERGIMLAYTVPPYLSEVLSVKSELKQVVIQLIQNGIQTTSKGGRVWVSAAPHNASFVALTVTDSGAGTSKGDTAKLFDAFYHRSNSSEATIGSGLGLTLVQQLVSRMGGSITVESTPGQGTTFKILLPASPPAVDTSATNSDGSKNQSASQHQTYGQQVSHYQDLGGSQVDRSQVDRSQVDRQEFSASADSSYSGQAESVRSASVASF